METDEKSICNNDIWEWQEDDYCLKDTTRSDLSHCLWDEVNQCENSLIYILDEQTPIKDCSEFVYQTSNVEENIQKSEERRDSSQQKRRRVLHFPHDSNETSVSTSVFLRSKDREDEQLGHGRSPSANAELNSQWDMGLSDGSCAFNSDAWDQPSEGWLVDDCLDSGLTHCKMDETKDPMQDLNCGEASIHEDHVADPYNLSFGTEKDLVQVSLPPSLLKLSKGTKSFIGPSTKLTSSVAYPFALIKPCGVEGDLTLKDINLRLHTPLSSRVKHMEDVSSNSYPTSAFSGKPVVVKKKIRTEGGKGSITIMRTKG